jgi:drug/metabolite transporter (DMT)-like permease
MALVVAIWGTTWHAIVYQINHTSPELGVTLRFGLAGLGVLAFAAWHGQNLRLPLRAHGVLALQGCSCIRCPTCVSTTPKNTCLRGWWRWVIRRRRCWPGWAPGPCGAPR